MNNTIVLIGRLTHKPELKYTTNNKAILKSTIAIQRDYKNSSKEYETDFIDFQIWEKKAETMAQYCEKGALIRIKGSLRVENYQDKEGNNKKRSYVFVEKVSFLQTKSKEERKELSVQKNEVIEENDPFREINGQFSLDDLDLNDSLPF